MVNADNNAKRENGIYYTPRELALSLVEPFAEKAVPASILDPACGDGSLLRAAQEVFSRGRRGRRPHVYGCDVSPNLPQLRELRPKRIWVKDFLELRLNRHFDLVLMNPPYVRHHGISLEAKQAYNLGVQTICALPKISDLWAYFVVQAVELVKDGGSVAAILPWAFLQADYARMLRRWLAERFATIEVTAISSQQFRDAEERIALVWLKSKGRSCQSITLRNVTDPSHSENTPKYNLSWSEWLRSRVVITRAGPVDEILSLFSDKGFVPFREIADTRIGTVTGADSFFIVDRRFAEQIGLKEKDYHRIIRSLRDHRGLRLNGNCPDQVLMHFSSKPKIPQVVQYLEKGRKEGVDQRAHCRRRSPWYAIPRPDPPDAFFPYRASHTPYLIINSPEYLCTNSVHAINWQKLTQKQIEWVQISLLSAPGQLSLEAHGKTYGSGVLKIEPSALGNTIVTTGGGRLTKRIYKRIDSLLNSNRRCEASEIATDVVQDVCGIDSETMQVCTSALCELRRRRLSSP
ncbi:MAG: N-6 DNA methylase [Thermodesulfobacteriota bacterium]|nr:N-6 DNA methylase [Thermodesulfobacteriota bacterium]